uniref:Uncharacterized protein n=1 Tax=Trichuris muris TaxID=70415 RepID=A0A5S6QDU0_TRIMR
MPRAGRSRREALTADQATDVPLDNGNVPEISAGDGKTAMLDCMVMVCGAVSKLSEKVDALLTGTSLARQVSKDRYLDAQYDLLHDVKLGDSAKTTSNAAETVQVDTFWFTSGATRLTTTMLPPNRWLQRLAPSASIDIFDVDPREWPLFIAGFKSMVGSRRGLLGCRSLDLTGAATLPFAGLLYLPTIYTRVLQDLHRLYGNKFAMVKSHAESLCQARPLSSESFQELERFYLQVHSPVSVLESSG